MAYRDEILESTQATVLPAAVMTKCCEKEIWIFATLLIIMRFKAYLKFK